MQQQDKGLIQFKGKPLVSYAIEHMAAVVDQLMINANRNLEQYRNFQYPVIADKSDSFDGPLAGVLAAMEMAEFKHLLVMPCDSPYFSEQHLNRLLAGMIDEQAEIAVAYDGERLHPVLLALKTSLASSLEDYLATGERKIDRWLVQHNLAKIDFSDEPSIFQNINTLEELETLQDKHD